MAAVLKLARFAQSGRLGNPAYAIFRLMRLLAVADEGGDRESVDNVAIVLQGLVDKDRRCDDFGLSRHLFEHPAMLRLGGWLGEHHWNEVVYQCGPVRERPVMPLGQ